MWFLVSQASQEPTKRLSAETSVLNRRKARRTSSLAVVRGSVWCAPGPIHSLPRAPSLTFPTSHPLDKSTHNHTQAPLQRQQHITHTQLWGTGALLAPHVR